MHGQMAEMKKGLDYHIHALTEGGYVLSVDMDDYGYETKEQLLSALADELGGVKENPEAVQKKSKKEKVKKMMEGDDEN